MSHVTGAFFMLDTMLRSGVPPHMGQSPVPGSEALSARVDTRQIRMLRFIGWESPSRCPETLQMARQRKVRGCRGTQEIRRFVLLAICRVRGRISAKPCRV